MAYYKDAKYLNQYDFAEFNVTHSPGDRALWSGIYRCDVCGKECVHTSENPFRLRITTSMLPEGDLSSGA